jgi:hypothetical protein
VAVANARFNGFSALSMAATELVYDSMSGALDRMSDRAENRFQTFTSFLPPTFLLLIARRRTAH